MRSALRKRPTWAFILGALLFIIGIPGTIDDTLAWWGVLGGRLPYLLAIAGIVVMFFSGRAALNATDSADGTTRVTEHAVVTRKESEPPPALADGGAIYDRLVEAAEATRANDQLKVVEGLLSKGGALRVTEARSAAPPDDLTKRYEPFSAAIHQIGHQARNMYGPTNVNAWLKEVARLVEAEFPHYAAQIVPRGLGKSDPQLIVAAIDKNIAVLRSIRDDLRAQ